MLDKLGDLLVELYHIRLPVDKVLDRLPVLEQLVAICLLRSSSKGIHKLANHLRGCESLGLRLFDP